MVSLGFEVVFLFCPIKRLAYDGAILVPIAVPCFCK